MIFKKKFQVTFLERVKSAVIGGAITFVIVYFIIPFPQFHLQNAIGNVISGVFCGFTEAFASHMVLMSKYAKDVE